MDTNTPGANNTPIPDDPRRADPPVRAEVDVVYFASVREAIGTGKETHNVPPDLVTLRDFIEWLRARGPEYETALSDDLGIRAAIDHVHATPDTPIEGAHEIAIFPMMTGGYTLTLCLCSLLVPFF